MCATACSTVIMRKFLPNWTWVLCAVTITHLALLTLRCMNQGFHSGKWIPRLSSLPVHGFWGPPILACCQLKVMFIAFQIGNQTWWEKKPDTSDSEGRAPWNYLCTSRPRPTSDYHFTLDQAVPFFSWRCCPKSRPAATAGGSLHSWVVNHG